MAGNRIHPNKSSEHRPRSAFSAHRLLWIALIAFTLAGAAGASKIALADDVASPKSTSQGITSQQLQASPATPQTYQLSPERRAKAIAYSHAHYLLYFLGTLASLGILYLLWRLGVTLALQRWAYKASSNLFARCLIFVSLFVLVYSVISLPLDFYEGYRLEHRFGLSTQTMTGWFSDWGKGLLIGAIIGTIVAWVFYAVIRKYPKRWWFAFWLASIPLVLCFILLGPEVIEPVFNHFTPLAQTQPVLATRIQSMLSNAGLEIPPSRVFEMNASSRTVKINAYVSGLGASKRVVIWDTTLKKVDPDAILLILGHEGGHYILHHIPKEFALDEMVALVLFLFGFYALNGLVRRAGPRFGINEVGDLAALPLVLIVFTLMGFFASPVVNGISRHFEHQADQFGLEAIHGAVADPNATAVKAFQILGKEDLADPDPNPLIKLWLYSHPPLDERIRFAAGYHPWLEGKPMELLPGPSRP